MSSAPLSRTSKVVVLGVFLAMVVDGMDLQMLSIALPSLSKDFQLSAVRAGALGTYTLLGMGLGGILAGWLSDRIGRVRVTWWSVLVFTACTGSVEFSQTYGQLAWLRFLSGFGIAGLYSTGTLLACEYVPSRVRTTVLGILMAGWSVGYVIAALLSTSIIPRFGWRPLFLCAVAPGLVVLAVLHGLPDPPSWSATRGALATARPGAAGFRLLWSHRSSRVTFILWTLTATALQCGYYGANTWLPSYLVKDLGVDLQHMGWYVAATYSMMVVGKIATGYLADLFGRRVVWVASCLLTAAYLPIFAFNATADNVAYLLLGFGLLYGAPYSVNLPYLSESFPATVRGTAVGAAYNIGRIGAMSSPILIGVAAQNRSIGAGLSLLGVSYAVCALIPGLFIAERMFDPNAVEGAADDVAREAAAAALAPAKRQSA